MPALAVWVSGPLTDFAIVQVKARSNVGTAVFVIVQVLAVLEGDLDRLADGLELEVHEVLVAAVVGLHHRRDLDVRGHVDRAGAGRVDLHLAEPVAPRLTVVVAPPLAWKTPGPESVSVASVHGRARDVTVRRCRRTSGDRRRRRSRGRRRS